MQNPFKPLTKEQKLAKEQKLLDRKLQIAESAGNVKQCLKMDAFSKYVEQYKKEKEALIDSLIRVASLSNAPMEFGMYAMRVLTSIDGLNCLLRDVKKGKVVK